MRKLCAGKSRFYLQKVGGGVIEDRPNSLMNRAIKYT